MFGSIKLALLQSSRIGITETEVIVNYRCLTTEKLKFVNSQIVLPPSKLLTMKTSAILPPGGVFYRPDLYS